MKDSDLEVYGILKTTVHPDAVEYQYALMFWKYMEEKYRDKKKRWLEARKARRLAAKMPTEGAGEEVQGPESERSPKDVKPPTEESDTKEEEDDQHPGYYDPHDDPEFKDAKDDEFSETDGGNYCDQVERYYSSLDKTSWEQIRNDIMNMHIQAETEVHERRRSFIRTMLLAIVVTTCLLLSGVYLMYKASTEEHRIELPPPPPAPQVVPEVKPPVTGCQLNCDQPSILDEIISKFLFPTAKANDKV